MKSRGHSARPDPHQRMRRAAETDESPTSIVQHALLDPKLSPTSQPSAVATPCPSVPPTPITATTHQKLHSSKECAPCKAERNSQHFGAGVELSQPQRMARKRHSRATCVQHTDTARKPKGAHISRTCLHGRLSRRLLQRWSMSGTETPQPHTSGPLGPCYLSTLRRCTRWCCGCGAGQHWPCNTRRPHTRRALTVMPALVGPSRCTTGLRSHTHAKSNQLAPWPQAQGTVTMRSAHGDNTHLG